LGGSKTGAGTGLFVFKNPKGSSFAG